ncbi:glycosyltransferase family 2 protein [Virgibacillus pantothenticus]|uniref:glycosyltransferase family 2 protein n=1 Tax=Virgibacillus pantothenticus TaxID=1473 RepID=UPI00067D5FA7|nr:glycosyltransferase [Virgibacillus pantothenticus]MED3735328.1 glycosyltransferase [Virgibacillus pantothenticus]QTY15964.1 glycosyltransferase [Virgibacillus pantothenticus]SIS74171.1 glycosyltransferase EpsJ [Virgibacillus pantothenticus]
MSKHKLVSFVIPVYNAEHSLKRCIKSILSQSYHSTEIILVNDGSTDKSTEICNSLAALYNNIHVIHQKNAGVSCARNIGIKKAKGAFLQFVDADDYIDSDMTKKLVEAVNSSPINDLVICGYESIATHKKKLYTPSIKGMYTKTSFLHYFGDLYKQIIIPSPCNKLYRLDIINQHNIKFKKNISFGEDLLFNLHYLQYCKRIYILHDSLYKYVNANVHSLSRAYRKNYFKEQQFLLNKVQSFLEEMGGLTYKNKRDLGEIYASSVINAYTNLFHKENRMPRIEKVNEMKTILHLINTNEELIHFTGSLQKQLVKLLIKLKSTYSLYIFFYVKSFLKRHSHKFFT